MKKYVFLLILVSCFLVQLLPVFAADEQIIALDAQGQTTVQTHDSKPIIQLYNDLPYDIQLTHISASPQIPLTYQDQDLISNDQLSEILLTQTIPSKQSLEIELQTDQEISLTIEWVPLLIRGYIFENNHEQINPQKQIKVDLWNQNGLIETTYTDKEGYYQFLWSDGSQYEIKIPQYESTYVLSNNDVTQYHDFHFAPPTYHLRYDINGGSIQSLLPQKSYLPETSITLLSHLELSYEGYCFVEWNEAKDGSGRAYHDNDVLTMPSHDVTLYAIWQKVEGQSARKTSRSNPPIIRKSQISHVKTSDETSITVLALLLLASISIMIVMKVLRKKENR